jgi:uncharacterized radical SAM superfamily Fe-S cluster-containing enzyme
MSRSPVGLFEVAFTQVDCGLRAYVTGINGTLETTLSYWRQIAAEARRTDPAALLVVDAIYGEPPPPEHLHEVVLAMKDEGVSHLRVAYVAEDVAQIPQIELAVLMANENGFKVRIFSEEREAVSWLRYGEQ